MNPSELLAYYKDDQRINQILEALSTYKTATIQLSGVAGSQDAVIGSLVTSQAKGTHIFIRQDKEEAAYLYNDLQQLSGNDHIFFFPSSFRNESTKDQIDKASVLRRTEALERLDALSSNRRTIGICVTYPEALNEGIIARRAFRAASIKLKLHQQIDLDALTRQLFDAGFEHCNFVGEPGEFTVRGGIVDVFSYSNDHPYRMEIVGDELASIRSFDTETQVSIEKINTVTLLPNLNEEDDEGRATSNNHDSFFSYVSEDATLWFNNYQLLLESADEEFVKEETIAEHAHVFLGGKASRATDVDIDFQSISQPVFNKNFELLIENLEAHRMKKYSNVIISENAKQIKRLYDIFEDIAAGKDNLTHENLFKSVMLSLHKGFIDHHVKLTCYTDHQIFNRYHRFVLSTSFSKKASITLKEFHNLQKGDYVVHIDHGIGKFAGLEKIDVHGKPQEAIRLVYKEGDILYVSIHSLHRISKYSGREGFAPRIDKLGSGTWKSLKQKTKKKIKDIAKELIKLYAKRKAQKGFQFSPDGYLQTELEASFIYEDTPDQFKASEATKADMESIVPMDRLVCGDVGFGKTEVAIRAAFKAATDGKQVAILVPTTILASQHYRTFSERLKEFPVDIDFINRFKSPQKQKETLKKLEEGKIDIIIGTHRLVSKDVKFKDLGLMIIDEEQKFGVATKDKLKNLRVNVDTLTLTATPIPRTLQFSLMNARDLSIINTPPPNRYPIQTELCVFNEGSIKEAIDQEIFRGGQVFFVHNRVQNIQDVAALIRKLCPDIRVGIGHGQMEGRELENVMMKFVEGEFDLLVATTIIESGLDIPNANTIIINNAHNFGLSDLHQMRGRVGRTNKKAFCYLITPPISSLTSEARKRLQTLEEFSELGSGFNIAMKDLDIRGAGNLLGAEQSGFINELGFETYHKILDEAVQELKETEFKDVFDKDEGIEDGPKIYVKDCQIETDMEILIPDYYVNSITERLRLYKELNEMKDEEALIDYELRLEDRFGAIPSQVKDLLNTMKLRWLGAAAGLEKLVLKQGRGIGYFVSNRDSDYYQSDQFTKVLAYVQNHPNESVLKEDRNKLVLVVQHLNSIGLAIEMVNLLLEKETVVTSKVA
ncbi:MAG: transcription-repair coupling factor [Flavobacteriales bacterium]|nr:transcription-repair coupling factor [Flavobacteriales bacterium]